MLKTIIIAVICGMMSAKIISLIFVYAGTIKNPKNKRGLFLMNLFGVASFLPLACGTFLIDGFETNNGNGDIYGKIGVPIYLIGFLYNAIRYVMYEAKRIRQNENPSMSYIDALKKVLKPKKSTWSIPEK